MADGHSRFSSYPTGHVRLEPICMLVCMVIDLMLFLVQSFFSGRVGLVAGSHQLPQA